MSPPPLCLPRPRSRTASAKRTAAPTPSTSGASTALRQDVAGGAQGGGGGWGGGGVGGGGCGEGHLRGGGGAGGRARAPRAGGGRACEGGGARAQSAAGGHRTQPARQLAHAGQGGGEPSTAIVSASEEGGWGGRGRERSDRGRKRRSKTAGELRCMAVCHATTPRSAIVQIAPDRTSSPLWAGIRYPLSVSLAASSMILRLSLSHSLHLRMTVTSVHLPKYSLTLWDLGAGGASEVIAQRRWR